MTEQPPRFLQRPSVAEYSWHIFVLEAGRSVARQVVVLQPHLRGRSGSVRAAPVACRVPIPEGADLGELLDRWGERQRASGNCSWQGIARWTLPHKLDVILFRCGEPKARAHASFYSQLRSIVSTYSEHVDPFSSP